MKDFDFYNYPTEPDDNELKEMLDAFGHEFVMKILTTCWEEHGFDHYDKNYNELDKPIQRYSPEQTRVLCWTTTDDMKNNWGCSHVVLLTYNYGDDRVSLASYGVNSETDTINCWAD